VLSEATRSFVDDQLVMGIDCDIVEDAVRVRTYIEDSVADF
jgi:hypothetical protein